MLPLKGSNSLNYVYPMWLNLPENYMIMRGPKFIPSKLTKVKISLNLVIGIILNLA